MPRKATTEKTSEEAAPPTSMLDAAQEAIAGQIELRLTPAQWKVFCERLDAPPNIIPALRDLFSEPEQVG